MTGNIITVTMMMMMMMMMMNYDDDDDDDDDDDHNYNCCGPSRYSSHLWAKPLNHKHSSLN